MKYLESSPPRDCHVQHVFYLSVIREKEGKNQYTQLGGKKARGWLHPGACERKRED